MTERPGPSEIDRPAPADAPAPVPPAPGPRSDGSGVSGPRSDRRRPGRRRSGGHHPVHVVPVPDRSPNRIGDRCRSTIPSFRSPTKWREKAGRDRRLPLGRPAATLRPGASRCRRSSRPRAFRSTAGATEGRTWLRGTSTDVITVDYYVAPPGDLASAIEGAAGTPATNVATAAGLRGHVQPDRPPLRTPGGPHPLLRHRHQRRTRWRPGPTPSGWPADPRVRLHRWSGSDPGVPGRAGPPPRAVSSCCGWAPPYSGYQQDAPYLWGLLPTDDTILSATPSPT